MFESKLPKLTTKSLRHVDGGLRNVACIDFVGTVHQEV
jgi:hypothetical protein